MLEEFPIGPLFCVGPAVIGCMIGSGKMRKDNHQPEPK